MYIFYCCFSIRFIQQITVKMLSFRKIKMGHHVVFNALCWYLGSRVFFGRYIQFHYGEWDAFCFISFFTVVVFVLLFILCLCFSLIWISQFKNPTHLGMVDTYWYVYCLQFPLSFQREQEGWWRCDKCCRAFGSEEIAPKQRSSSTEDWFLLCNSPQRLRLMTLYARHPSASPLAKLHQPSSRLHKPTYGTTAYPAAEH